MQKNNKGTCHMTNTVCLEIASGIYPSRDLNDKVLKILERFCTIHHEVNGRKKYNDKFCSMNSIIFVNFLIR